MDVGFHVAVAEASHYRILVIMSYSVNDLMRASCRDNLGGQLQSVREQVYHAHYLIFHRIKTRDPEGAYEAMQQHLRTARSNYRSTWVGTTS